MILVLLQERESYGYELIQRLRHFETEVSNPGTLYRTLRRLEREGWCISEWETPKGGPARRRYSVTIAGQDYLDLWVKALEKYQQSVDDLVRLYIGKQPS